MDDEQAPAARPPLRKRRRLWKILGALAVLAIALVVSIPWLLGTGPVRGWLIGRINARLSPGSVEVTRLNVSWTRSIAMTGVGLRDPKGKLVLTARRVELDRGILGLLASRPNYGTVTVEGVTVDVNRRADGSIDLLDALGLGRPDPAAGPAPAPAPSPSPAPTGDSKMAVVVLVHGGTMRIASPELAEPLVATSVEGSATMVPGKPLDLSATLGDGGGSLELQAMIDHRAPEGTPGDQALKVAGKGWPIHVRGSGTTARGRYEGTLEAKREHGLWTIRGAPSILGVEAVGPALAGDRLAIDRVDAACDVGQSASGWAIRRFDVNCRVGSITASGAVPAAEGTPARITGRVDVAALAKLLPNAMRLRDGLTVRRGTANLRADLTNSGGADRVELVASLDDLVAVEKGRPFTLRDPVRLTASASRAAEKVAIERVEVKAAGVDVTGGGDLDSGFKVTGTADLAAMMAQARDLLDLGEFNLAGQARLAGDYRREGVIYRARLAADCRGLVIAGVKAEPIRRDLIRLDATADGPRRPDGTPDGFHAARLDFKAGDVLVDVAATSRDGTVAVLASGGFDVDSPAPGRLKGMTSFRWKDNAFDVDELRAGLLPADPAVATGVVAIAARGRFDPVAGWAAFDEIPGEPVGALGLAPGGVKVSGLGRADAPLRVDASLVGDLGALDRLAAAWSGSALKGLEGAWSARARVDRSAAGKLDVDGRLDAADLAPVGLPGPASIAIRGGYLPDVDRVDLASMVLTTGPARIALDGSLAGPGGRRQLAVKGTIEPRWEAVDRILATAIAPDARARATFRPFHLEGSLAADTTPQILGQLRGEIGLDLVSAEALGVKVGPTPIVLKMGDGRAVFDPIAVPINGGAALLMANLGLDDAYGLRLRIDPDSHMDGALIDDVVSEALLAYVVPVLGRASEVTGKVSIGINRASVPLTGGGAMSFDGLVALQDVTFRPGPLGAEIASISGRPAPRLQLSEVMQVQVVDGRVRQTGLSIPMGGGAKVAIDGSVGFDKTLDLRMTFPVTARMLGLDPKLGGAVGGTKVAVPIRGTLSRPGVDRKALQVALREAARSAAGRGLESEAGRLLDRVAGPGPGAAGGRPKAGRRDAAGELENLGRELIKPRRP